MHNKNCLITHGTNSPSETNTYWLCIQIKMSQNLMQCENHHLKQLWDVAICDQDS